MTELKTACKKNETEPREIKRVCFVCTGNTCRSPMAEAVANALAEEALRALPEAVREHVSLPWEAVSAGLYPNAGEPIHPHALAALEAAGVAPARIRDYRRHTASPLTEELVADCDLLVGMSAGHVFEMMMRFPKAAQRILCMPREIADPYGGTLADYQACLAEITDGVRQLLLSGGSLT